MENKNLLHHLKENDTLYKSIVNRVQTNNYHESEETAFFAELLSMFGEENTLPIQQLSSFRAETIIDYLRKSHIFYLSKKLPEIELILSRLELTSGDLPEYLSGMIGWLQKNMEKHFRIEEQSLFPYIIDLEKVYHKTEQKTLLKERYKDFTISRFMENHHDDVENKLSEIKKYIVRSVQTKDELFPFRVLLNKLDELEKDLRLHAKVEDDILVPKALVWENVNNLS